MSDSPIPSESPGRVGAQIVDSSLELIRAEIGLLWSRAIRLGARGAVAVGISWAAMTLTQIALLMLVLSPLIAAAFSTWAALASVLPILFVTVLAWILTLRSWRLLLDKKREPAKAGGTTRSDDLG